jgi:poly-beta-1,6-N-acetyl-D-glucosamine synthase
LIHFLTLQRLLRVFQTQYHKMPKLRAQTNPADSGGEPRREPGQRGLHVWKADFNQCSGRQLIGALENAQARRREAGEPEPAFVLIGHSKLFNWWNERSLECFLKHVSENPASAQFGLYPPRPISTSKKTPAKTPEYVLVTPVRNEEATIGITIESVLAQSIPPRQWIIVSDESTDRTDEIVRQYERKTPWLRLLRLTNRPARGFGSIVPALNAGYAALEKKDVDFIGYLDADVQFGPAYYQTLMERFAQNPALGLAGGLVLDKDCAEPQIQWMGDVAGAVQFFRRSCFEQMGGLVSLPLGGWDGVTCMRARKAGFETATFGDLAVAHLKPRNQGEKGSVLRKQWCSGIRDYDMGYDLLFEFAKSVFRIREHPVVIYAAMRLLGFISCYLRFRKRLLNSSDLAFIRREHTQRLFNFRHCRPRVFKAQ